MEKRQKKILLLSIFGGAAALLVVGYFAFLFWIILKAFPTMKVKDIASNFITLVDCQTESGRNTADPKCTKAFTEAFLNKPKEQSESPEYNQCVYEQEILLEAIQASKSNGADFLNERIAGYCNYLTNSSKTIDSANEDNFKLLKNIKAEIASQEILNYRYKFFKKKNYTLELQALEPYRQFTDATKTCADFEKTVKELDSRGSIFNLGTIAVCKLQKCVEEKETTCPEALKFAQRMKAQGDIGAEFIYLHEAALLDKSSKKAVSYARKALLNGYTDLISTYPEIEEDFYKIKFNTDSLNFSAARLAYSTQIYIPALNCVAASLDKDQEFETFLKSPQTQPMSVWAEKIKSWADEDSNLLLRVACEVLTDVESKKRIHNYYMNDGNEDGSAFDFCSMIEDPLFKGVCTTK